ncbi:glycosyltransferase family 4 protein [Luteitalea pratensis]|uniref:glycosyltransferase family 4 protein n=1 Tax=Luteitalea pratensis TaxID=1855912 RepID=UPI000D727CCF|nr:glycosyltransferase family 4 protein [Luteitalea pratensis]
MALTVLVCEAQVPFVKGGAEALVRELVRQLEVHGCLVERVSVPFKWYPKQELMAHAAAWRLLDLSESCGRPIDLVIPTKFPTYCVRHPRKVTWLMHQYRAAYDLCGTEYADFDHREEDTAVRERIRDLDREMLGECAGVYTISRTTSDRLTRFNGVPSTPLYHPSPLAPRLRAGEYGEYFLSVGRLETVKRVELAISAMAYVPPPMRLLVAGEGTYRHGLEQRIEALGLGDRVSLLGAVDEATLIDLYAGARGVVFAPFDEDYGYVTLEAFEARKPVVTASDSGGVLEFVQDDVNGLVCPPDAAAIGACLADLAARPERAAALGEAGYDSTRAISWDGVVAALTASSARREESPVA